MMNIKQGISLCVFFHAQCFMQMVSADELLVPRQSAVQQPFGKPPDGYKLRETKMCMEERRNGPYGRPLPAKKFSIAVATWVPINNCLKLDADGKLVAVPGDCQAVPATVESCE